MEDIVNLIMNNGMACVIVGYFLYKDWKLTTKLNETLSAVNEHLRNEEKIIYNKEELKNANTK